MEECTIPTVQLGWCYWRNWCTSQNRHNEEITLYENIEATSLEINEEVAALTQMALPGGQ